VSSHSASPPYLTNVVEPGPFASGNALDCSRKLVLPAMQERGQSCRHYRASNPAVRSSNAPGRGGGSESGCCWSALGRWGLRRRRPAFRSVYDGYSFKDQAISELSAYPSPLRPLAVTWIALHNLLGIAFGVGVWLSAGGSRALRWTAGFLLAANVITTPLHPFFPMSSRGMETGFNDTMHLILTMAFGLFVFGAVAASAVAIRGWFRLYAIASLVVIMAFGGLTGPLMSEIANNQPTPWLGAFERINAYTTFAWMVVLAVVLIRRTVGESSPEPERAPMPASTDRALATTPRR
jgi:Protein of unknown function (DUF998)